METFIDTQDQSAPDMSRVAAPPQNGPADIQALPAPVQPPSNIGQPSAGGPLPAQWWIPPAQNQQQQQPWSALPFAQAAFSQLPPHIAGPAITQALRLEGLLGFDADRKAGVPVAEAMAKWASKLYADHPSVAASLSRQPAKPFVPNEINVGGQSLIQMSPNRYSYKPNAPGENLKPAELMHGTVSELNQLSKAIDHAMESRDQPAARALRQRYNEALNRLHDMTAPPQAKRPRPKKGDIVDDHEFLDNPSLPANNPKNWKALK